MSRSGAGIIGARPVGLIVNPFAGRDVRRLVAPAGSLSNYQRATMVRCLLGGLRASGVREVLYMPDAYGVVARAAEESPGIVAVPALESAGTGPADTTRAARAMVDAGVGVIITLGGDGTNRLVAIAAGETPLLPVPGGTNNAFADAVEPTAAGLAAGFVTRMGFRGAVRHRCIRRRKRIVVSVGVRSDIALVDAVLTSDLAISARAVWEPSHLRMLMVTQAEPGALGLSSLVAAIRPVGAFEPRGVAVDMGSGTKVCALLTPGVVALAEVRSVREVGIGASVVSGPVSGTISLDGERTFEVRREAVRMTIDAGGPWVVDILRVLRRAQSAGLFLHRGVARAMPAAT